MLSYAEEVLPMSWKFQHDNDHTINIRAVRQIVPSTAVSDGTRLAQKQSKSKPK